MVWSSGKVDWNASTSHIELAISDQQVIPALRLAGITFEIPLLDVRDIRQSGSRSGHYEVHPPRSSRTPHPGRFYGRALRHHT